MKQPKKHMTETQRERILQYAYGMSSTLGGARGPKPKTKAGRAARRKGKNDTLKSIKKHGMPRYRRDL